MRGWRAAALVLGMGASLALACAGRSSEPRARSTERVALADASPTPPAAVTCPVAPERLRAGDEPRSPAWAAGQVLVRCGGRPGVHQLCGDEDGRVIVEERDEPRRPRRFFDREGRIEEEWWNGDGSARAHTTTRRSPGCVVEAYDYDGDSLVDSVCRTLTPCDSGACRTCGPFLRPIAGAPCAAGCAKDFTRCGCDERGDVEEEIADGSHTRRTTRRTDGGRRVERVVFHAEEELAREQRTYDAEGRVVEETTRDASGTRSTRTTFKGDGSSTATTTFDGAVVSLTTVDLSVPGERRDRVASGGQVETWLTRARGSEAVTIEFAAPMDESWFTCARDADCAAWVDRCDCDRGYTVNRRYLDRLRALRSAGCREPHGCPAELPARTTVARCVASLCAPGAP